MSEDSSDEDQYSEHEEEDEEESDHEDLDTGYNKFFQAFPEPLRFTHEVRHQQRTLIQQFLNASISGNVVDGENVLNQFKSSMKSFGLHLTKAEKISLVKIMVPLIEETPIKNPLLCHFLAFFMYLFDHSSTYTIKDVKRDDLVIPCEKLIDKMLEIEKYALGPLEMIAKLVCFYAHYIIYLLEMLFFLRQSNQHSANLLKFYTNFIQRASSYFSNEAFKIILQLFHQRALLMKGSQHYGSLKILENLIPSYSGPEEELDIKIEMINVHLRLIASFGGASWTTTKPLDNLMSLLYKKFAYSIPLILQNEKITDALYKFFLCPHIAKLGETVWDTKSRTNIVFGSRQIDFIAYVISDQHTGGRRMLECLERSLTLLRPGSHPSLSGSLNLKGLYSFLDWFLYHTEVRMKREEFAKGDTLWPKEHYLLTNQPLRDRLALALWQCVQYAIYWKKFLRSNFPRIIFRLSLLSPKVIIPKILEEIETTFTLAVDSSARVKAIYRIITPIASFLATDKQYMKALEALLSTDRVMSLALVYPMYVNSFLISLTAHIPFAEQPGRLVAALQDIVPGYVDNKVALLLRHHAGGHTERTEACHSSAVKADEIDDANDETEHLEVDFLTGMIAHSSEEWIDSFMSEQLPKFTAHTLTIGGCARVANVLGSVCQAVGMQRYMSDFRFKTLVKAVNEWLSENTRPPSPTTEPHIVASCLITDSDPTVVLQKLVPLFACLMAPRLSTDKDFARIETILGIMCKFLYLRVEQGSIELFHDLFCGALSRFLEPFESHCFTMWRDFLKERNMSEWPRKTCLRDAAITHLKAKNGVGPWWSEKNPDMVRRVARLMAPIFETSRGLATQILDSMKKGGSTTNPDRIVFMNALSVLIMFYHTLRTTRLPGVDITPAQLCKRLGYPESMANLSELRAFAGQSVLASLQLTPDDRASLDVTPVFMKTPWEKFDTQLLYGTDEVPAGKTFQPFEQSYLPMLNDAMDTLREYNPGWLAAMFSVFQNNNGYHCQPTWMSACFYNYSHNSHLTMSKKTCSVVVSASKSIRKYQAFQDHFAHDPDLNEYVLSRVDQTVDRALPFNHEQVIRHAREFVEALDKSHLPLLIRSICTRLAPSIENAQRTRHIKELIGMASKIIQKDSPASGYCSTSILLPSIVKACLRTDIEDGLLAHIIEKVTLFYPSAILPFDQQDKLSSGTIDALLNWSTDHHFLEAEPGCNGVAEAERKTLGSMDVRDLVIKAGREGRESICRQIVEFSADFSNIKYVCLLSRLAFQLPAWEIALNCDDAKLTSEMINGWLRVAESPGANSNKFVCISMLFLSIYHAKIDRPRRIWTIEGEDLLASPTRQVEQFEWSLYDRNNLPDCEKKWDATRFVDSMEKGIPVVLSTGYKARYHYGSDVSVDEASPPEPNTVERVVLDWLADNTRMDTFFTSLVETIASEYDITKASKTFGSAILCFSGEWLGYSYRKFGWKAVGAHLLRQAGRLWTIGTGKSDSMSDNHRFQQAATFTGFYLYTLLSYYSAKCFGFVRVEEVLKKVLVDKILPVLLDASRAAVVDDFTFKNICNMHLRPLLTLDPRRIHWLVEALFNAYPASYRAQSMVCIIFPCMLKIKDAGLFPQAYNTELNPSTLKINELSKTALAVGVSACLAHHEALTKDLCTFDWSAVDREILVPNLMGDGQTSTIEEIIREVVDNPESRVAKKFRYALAVIPCCLTRIGKYPTIVHRGKDMFQFLPVLFRVYSQVHKDHPYHARVKTALFRSFRHILCERPGFDPEPLFAHLTSLPAAEVSPFKVRKVTLQLIGVTAVSLATEAPESVIDTGRLWVRDQLMQTFNQSNLALIEIALKMYVGLIFMGFFVADGDQHDQSLAKCLQRVEREIAANGIASTSVSPSDVLTLCAFVASSPHEIPPWCVTPVATLAKMCVAWSRFSTSTTTVNVDAKKALVNIHPTLEQTLKLFTRTHQDSWRIFKQLFTEDQLDAIKSCFSFNYLA